MDKTAVKEIKAELVEHLHRLYDENPEIILISLCTTDGFNIKALYSNEISIESDKMAAISSTICALSGSAAKQIMREKFNTTIIETHSDNMLFLSSRYLGVKCVLTVVAKPKMSLATARYCTRRLSEQIKAIT